MVKFLIIRFSSIGDIVLTTPVIRGIKKQVEGAEVHFLTKRNFESVLKHNPYIDKQFVLGEDFNSLIKELKEESYDYIIDLHKNLRTLRVRRALKRHAFTFDKLNRQKWLTVHFKKKVLPDVHIVDRYYDTVSAFSVEKDSIGLDYYIDDAIDSGIHQKNYVVFVVGAKHKTKQIPVEVAGKIIGGIKSKVILIGGKEDMDIAGQIESGLKEKVINKVGQCTLMQSALIIKNAKVVVTPDTGMMHIASAFKKNIVSLWGNTIPEFGMYPYMPGDKSKIFQVNGLKCRPCSKLGFDECPKKHFNCMMQQDTETISTYVNKIGEE